MQLSQEGQNQPVRLSLGWHMVHLLIILVETKNATQPKPEVIQGQNVGPAMALAEAHVQVEAEGMLAPLQQE